MTKKRASGEGSLFYSQSEERWIAEISLPDGKRKKKRAKTQKEAQDWLLEIRQQVHDGFLLKDENVKVSEFLTKFLEEVAIHSVKPSTYRSYSQLVNTHVIPAIGHIKLVKLRPDHLQSLYSKKLTDGLSKRSVQYMHAVVRRALNQAVKWGLIVRNPTDAVTPPKPQRREPQTLSSEQAKTLIDSVSEPRWKTIYVIAILLGLRKSEILGLRWQDIDFNNNAISINNIVYEIDGKIYTGTPKTNTSRRTVAMPDLVAETLIQYQKLTNNYAGLVFTTSSGRPVSQRNLSRHFYTALDKAELPRIRFHDLRHTAATLLLKENVHPKIVQEMLGHSSIALTLDTYSHVIPSMQKEAASKMDELFK
jgi:integrase